MVKLRCGDVRDLLDAFVDAELPAAQDQAVREHLQGCSECRLEYRRLARTVALLNAVDRPAMPERVRDGVRARIAEIEARPLWPRAIRPVAAALACLLLFTVGVAFVRMQRPDRGRLIQDARPSTQPVLSATIAPPKVSAELVAPQAVRSTPPETVAPAKQAEKASPPRPRLHTASAGRRAASTIPMPESFLDVPDSRGITARDLLEARSSVPAIFRPAASRALAVDAGAERSAAAPSPVPETQTEDRLNDRVRIGDRVTVLRGVAQWDERGRLQALRVHAETEQENAQEEPPLREREGSVP